MSRHTFIQGLTQVGDGWEDRKWVFGWDQPLQSFYLQKHDALVEDPDENPVLWLGATSETEMYEVEHLVQVASEHGLEISRKMQITLYGEKDAGV